MAASSLAEELDFRVNLSFSLVVNVPCRLNAWRAVGLRASQFRWVVVLPTVQSVKYRSFMSFTFQNLIASRALGTGNQNASP